MKFNLNVDTPFSLYFEAQHSSYRWGKKFMIEWIKNWLQRLWWEELLYIFFIVQLMFNVETVQKACNWNILIYVSTMRKVCSPFYFLMYKISKKMLFSDDFDNDFIENVCVEVPSSNKVLKKTTSGWLYFVFCNFVDSKLARRLVDICCLNLNKFWN